VGRDNYHLGNRNKTYTLARGKHMVKEKHKGTRITKAKQGAKRGENT